MWGGGKNIFLASPPSLALCFQPRSRPFVWLLARTWIRKNTDCFAVYQTIGSEHLKKCRGGCRVGARGSWVAASFLGQTAACRAEEIYFQVSGPSFILGSGWADPLPPSRCGTAIDLVVLISMTHTPPLNKKVLISWGRRFSQYSVVRAREPASFWWENEIDGFQHECRTRDRNKLSNARSYTIQFK